MNSLYWGAYPMQLFCWWKYKVKLLWLHKWVGEYVVYPTGFNYTLSSAQTMCMAVGCIVTGRESCSDMITHTILITPLDPDSSKHILTFLSRPRQTNWRDAPFFLPTSHLNYDDVSHRGVPVRTIRFTDSVQKLLNSSQRKVTLDEKTTTYNILTQTTWNIPTVLQHAM